MALNYSANGAIAHSRKTSPWRYSWKAKNSAMAIMSSKYGNFSYIAIKHFLP